MEDYFSCLPMLRGREPSPWKVMAAIAEECLANGAIPEAVLLSAIYIPDRYCPAVSTLWRIPPERVPLLPA